MAKTMRITESKCLAMHLALEHMEEALGDKIRFAGITVDPTDCGEFLSIDIFGLLKIIKTGRKYKFLANVHLKQDLDGNWNPETMDTHININGKSGADVQINFGFVRFDENGKKIKMPEPTEEELALMEMLW